MILRHLAPCALTVLAASCAFSGEEQGTSGPQWTELFNGQDLTGWQVKIRGYELGDNHGDTFRVEDGLLKVSYDQYESFDGVRPHLLRGALLSYDLRVTTASSGTSAGGPGQQQRRSTASRRRACPRTRSSRSPSRASSSVRSPAAATGHREPVRPRHPRGHGRSAAQAALHQLHRRDLHGRRVGHRRVPGARQRERHPPIDGQPVLAYQQPQLDPGDDKARRLMNLGQSAMLSRGTISLQAESHPIEFKSVAVKVYQ